MSVDLPAPLSPSRHMTSPGWTVIETSLKAMTEPNILETASTFRSGVDVERDGRSGVAGSGGRGGHRRASVAGWRMTPVDTTTATISMAPSTT